MCTCATVYIRTVHAYLVTTYSRCSGPGIMCDAIYLYPLVSIALNDISPWAKVITDMRPVINEIIIDKRSVVYIFAIIRRSSPVMDGLVFIHILRGDKYPPAFRAIISNSDAYTRTKWRPSAIATAITPAYPCRSPFITWYPNPAIIRVISPAAVVVASPAPWIIGYPGISVIGHYPMSARTIGPEITFFIRYPNVAILRVIHPLSVRR